MFNISADEIRSAARRLPVHLKKRTEGSLLIRVVTFGLFFENRSSVETEQHSSIDHDAAVSGEGQHYLGDKLAEELIRMILRDRRDRGPNAADMEVLRRFHNRVRILANIDRWDLEKEAPFTREEWQMFVRDPISFFIRCRDDQRLSLWKVVCRRELAEGDQS